MVPKTNRIEDFPDHWQSTLLGVKFWKDAEEWNHETNNKIEADHNSSLHTRFPFNIGPEQTPPPRAPSITTAAADSDCEVEGVVLEKRSRRFSMSDALTVNTFTGRSGSSLFPTNRFLDLGRQSRSRSRSRPNNTGRSSSVAADVRRSNSMIRSTFNRLSRRKKMRDDGEEEEELELHVKERAIVTPTFPPDQATPTNPLMEFRGGALWAAIPRNRRVLGLDVFWPVQTDNLMHETEKASTGNQNRIDAFEGEEDGEPAIFPISGMAPLCMFRNLRILKLTGMMQSYQMYIFQAAWLNTDLEELEIEMALAPRLRRGYKWPFMKGDWRLDKANYGEPVYYGNGEGSLVRTVGIGEYLDKICLEKAKIRAMATGSTRNRLSIRTLVLSGVVVDADPFLHWFDPKRLKCINLKENCVDAGFWLPHCMKKVTVLFPRQIDEPTVIGRRVDSSAELKVVELKGGKKIGEIPYRGPKSLEEGIPRNVGVKTNSIKRGENAKDHILDKDQVEIAI